MMLSQNVRDQGSIPVEIFLSVGPDLLLQLHFVHFMSEMKAIRNGESQDFFVKNKIFK